MPAASALLRGLEIRPVCLRPRAARPSTGIYAKISDRRGGEFSGFARRQDAEIPGVFQGRQHSKTEQFTPLRRIALWLYCLPFASAAKIISNAYFRRRRIKTLGTLPFSSYFKAEKYKAPIRASMQSFESTKQRAAMNNR